MGKFIKGDIVVIPFPFSDLSGSKRRPALVIAGISGDDVILCQITSAARNDSDAVVLETADFEQGTLPVKSFVRPNKIFTAAQQLILNRACRLKPEKMREITAAIVQILEQ
ncbi:MAG: type II toxin-antitoxin system PemK/MazF family toxin [Planctomycetaceae bacterium]|nr:type II toxin-antitoxin system PemK/MazF family toxin [Planctomycetaceae bacterium]